MSSADVVEECVSEYAEHVWHTIQAVNAYQFSKFDIQEFQTISKSFSLERSNEASQELTQKIYGPDYEERFVALHYKLLRRLFVEAGVTLSQYSAYRTRVFEFDRSLNLVVTAKLTQLYFSALGGETA